MIKTSYINSKNIICMNRKFDIDIAELFQVLEESLKAAVEREANNKIKEDQPMVQLWGDCPIEYGQGGCGDNECADSDEDDECCGGNACGSTATGKDADECCGGNDCGRGGKGKVATDSKNSNLECCGGGSCDSECNSRPKERKNAPTSKSKADAETLMKGSLEEPKQRGVAFNAPTTEMFLPLMYRKTMVVILLISFGMGLLFVNKA